MNKTLFVTEGGVPFNTDLWDFSQQATRDAFAALFAAFSLHADDAFIIQGCVRSGGGGTSMAAGYAWIAGEICVVDAQTLPALGGGESWFWEPLLSYHANDPLLMGDGSSENLRQIRKGKISKSGTPPDYDIDDTWIDRMRIMLDNESDQDDWHEVGAVGEPAFGTNWSASEDVKFIRLGTLNKAYSQIVIVGMCSKSTNSVANEVIFTLPSGYRPAADTTFVMPHSTTNFGIVVKTNGEVQIDTGSLTGPLTVFNGKVSFYIAN
jgi:hypothetical protein